MNKQITLQKVYVIFLCFHIVMLIIAGFTVKEDKFNLGEEHPYAEITPERLERTTDGAQQYTFTIKESRMNSYLLFYTNHQEVHVYADNELIYERNKSNSIFGHTTGAVWNFLEFPADTKEIVITTKAIYQSGINNEHTFYRGNGIEILRQIIQNSILSILICIFLLIFGICMILYWLLICRKTRVAKELLYMGILLILVGIWSFGEEKSVMILLSNRVFASYLTYITLMLMGVTFFLFLKQYIGKDNRYFHRFLALLAFGGTFLMMVLQWFHIKDFKETVLIVHITLICDLAYLLFNILRKKREKKSKKNFWLNTCALIVLAATVGFELYAYYVHMENMQAFAMLGLLAYITILAIEIGSNASDKIEEIRKAEIYKELAVKDMLTQCFNRNAYNETIQKDFDHDCTYLVMLDLNNLKKCNDTLGHMEGDRYLTDSAKLIKEVFENYGQVYRIGGDEFCIIMENIMEEKIQDLLKKLIHEEESYNEQSKTVYMQIASGYAKYDANIDANLDQTRCRADILMYENKKMLKAAQKK